MSCLVRGPLTPAPRPPSPTPPQPLDPSVPRGFVGFSCRSLISSLKSPFQNLFIFPHQQLLEQEYFSFFNASFLWQRKRLHSKTASGIFCIQLTANTVCVYKNLGNYGLYVHQQSKSIKKKIKKVFVVFLFLRIPASFIQIVMCRTLKHLQHFSLPTVPT